jgi:hypothetical protein
VNIYQLLAAFGGGTPERTTILLQVASASQEATGGASAEIIAYRSTHGTRAGEVWGEDGFSKVLQFKMADPDGTKIAGWEIKWEPLSGDEPNVGDPSGTWIDLTADSFQIEWYIGSGGGADELSGTVTVSLRDGPGDPSPQTAIWDGEAIKQKKGA